MPRPKRTAGRLEEVVAQLDQTLLDDVGIPAILEAGLKVPDFYINQALHGFQDGLEARKPPSPPDHLIAMHLAVAGILASREGGISTLAPLFGRPKRRSPAARGIQDFLERMTRFILGVDAIESIDDLYRYKELVRFGLEAYGLLKPPEAKIGRPAYGIAESCVRNALALNFKRVRARMTTKRQVLWRLAEIRQAYPKRVSDAQLNERLVEAEFRNLEQAYLSVGEMSCAEVASRRLQLAQAVLYLRRYGSKLPESLRIHTKGKVI
jgi:hypothetical protein